MTQRPGLVGGLAGIAVFAWLLTEGTFDLVAADDSARFFDAQTSAWLDGRWDLDPFVAGVEGIVRDGRTYIYFGVFPSVLRLPVALVAELDGQWSRLSMLGAVAVAMAATRWIAGEVLIALRPERSATGWWLTAGSVFTVGAGSSLTFLASRPLVYHEAGLWGAAMALVVLAAALTHHRTPSPHAVAVMGFGATASLLSRPSVALGALAVIGLFALGESVRRWGERAPDRLRFVGRAAPGERPTPLAPLIGASLVPLVAYTAVVAARFGTFLRIPFDDQVIATADPERLAFVETYGYFDPRFVGTNLVNYVAPIGARPVGRFPFLDFSAPPGPQLGDTPLAAYDRVAGLPIAMPALLVAAVVGLVVLARRRHRPDLHGLITVSAAGTVSGAAIIAFGALAHRYTADFVPALLVPAVVGAAAVGRSCSCRRVIAGVAGGLVALSVGVNLGLGLTYQRLWGLGVREETIADFLDTQADLGPDPGPVEAVDLLPPSGHAGDLLSVGDCAGLYMHSGRATSVLEPTPWLPVERTADAGRLELIADLDLPESGVVLPLVVDEADPVNVVSLRVHADGAVQFVYEGAPFATEGPNVELPDRPVHLDVVLDRHLGSVTVRLDDVLVLSGFYAALDPDLKVVGPAELAALGAGGSIVAADSRQPLLCRRLEED